MAGDNDNKNDSKKEREKEKKSEKSKEQKSSKKSLEKPDVQQVSSVGSGGETAGGSADAITTETIDVLRDIPSNQLVQFMSALNKFVAHRSADGSPDSHLAFSGPAKNSSPVRSKPVQFQKDVHVPGRIGAGSKAAKALPYSPISENSSDDESLLPVSFDLGKMYTFGPGCQVKDMENFRLSKAIRGFVHRISEFYQINS